MKRCLLLEHGADYKLTNSHGKTALQVANEAGHDTRYLDDKIQAIRTNRKQEKTAYQRKVDHLENENLALKKLLNNHQEKNEQQLSALSEKLEQAHALIEKLMINASTNPNEKPKLSENRHRIDFSEEQLEQNNTSDVKNENKNTRL